MSVNIRLKKKSIEQFWGKGNFYIMHLLLKKLGKRMCEAEVSCLDASVSWQNCNNSKSMKNKNFKGDTTLQIPFNIPSPTVTGQTMIQ